jgi:hypothetical protein
MVKGEIFAAPAILTGEAVTQKHVESREGRIERRAHIVL